MSVICTLVSYTGVLKCFLHFNYEYKKTTLSTANKSLLQKTHLVLLKANPFCIRTNTAFTIPISLEQLKALLKLMRHISLLTAQWHTSLVFHNSPGGAEAGPQKQGLGFVFFCFKHVFSLRVLLERSFYISNTEERKAKTAAAIKQTSCSTEITVFVKHWTWVPQHTVLLEYGTGRKD